MVVFAVCAHRDALIVLRIAALAGAAGVVAIGVAIAPKPLRLMGFGPIDRRRLPRLAVAAAFGAALAVAHRAARQGDLLPGPLTWFALAAAGVGACEEIAYRGFVQGCLRRHGWLLACVAAAIAHTAYKCVLLAGPSEGAEANLVVLAIATLTVGIVLGAMREHFGGVVFPLVAHAAFDVLVYGDLHAAPWWV